MSGSQLKVSPAATITRRNGQIFGQSLLVASRISIGIGIGRARQLTQPGLARPVS